MFFAYSMESKLHVKRGVAAARYLAEVRRDVTTRIVLSSYEADYIIAISNKTLIMDAIQLLDCITR
jgi:hypothetical protein